MNHKKYWDVITEKTGYDFSGYSKESLNSRLEKFISCERIGSADELKDRFSSEVILQDKILKGLLTNYTEMFRDPEFYYSIRRNVLPFLSTYSKICIWHAGCSTGEEVYSLLIMLNELKLIDRCEILATDINGNNLKVAMDGIYPLQRMQEATARYFRAGGRRNLSNYYTVFYDNVIFHSELRNRIKFVQQDLMESDPFKRFHLILCRNVFIYFDQVLQRRVMGNICRNLFNYGYLGIGKNEMNIEPEMNNLSEIDKSNKIFRKVI